MTRYWIDSLISGLGTPKALLLASAALLLLTAANVAAWRVLMKFRIRLFKYVPTDDGDDDRIALVFYKEVDASELASLVPILASGLLSTAVLDITIAAPMEVKS